MTECKTEYWVAMYAPRIVNIHLIWNVLEAVYFPWFSPVWNWLAQWYFSGEIQLQVKVDQADIFFLSVSSMKFVMALPLISQRPSTAIDWIQHPQRLAKSLNESARWCTHKYTFIQMYYFQDYISIISFVWYYIKKNKPNSWFAFICNLFTYSFLYLKVV